LGPIQVRRFFGGSGLLVEGVQFAFVIKGTLYFRVDGVTRSAYEKLGAEPFAYSARAARVKVASYYAVPADILDDAEKLQRWAVEARGAALKARRGVT
jgi:TfoX/Sxy family transcriptional regulator of competence genes